MLVLTRKLGETVVIQGDIHVTVVAIGSGRVRLGFTAPASVEIQREELGSPSATEDAGSPETRTR